MKLWSVLVLASVSTVSTFCMTTNAADGLVMHEWGTFTSFSGSDGIKLEFRPLVDNDLPKFVIDRARQAGKVVPFTGKTLVRSVQRMETPVTYFYTDHEQQITARVKFPEGLLTEFFPPVQSFTPAYQNPLKSPFLSDAQAAALLRQLVLSPPSSLTKLKNSELNWGTLTLIPPESLKPSLGNSKVAAAAHRRILNTLTPQSTGFNHYQYARETDSAFIHVTRPPNPKLPFAPHGDFFEKFLFYRGVGNFDLPLSLQAAADGRYLIDNTGTDELRSLFLVHVDKKGLKFVKHEQLAAGEQATLRHPTKASNWPELMKAIQQALVQEGLYQKEAVAMVNTWRDSWFGEHGTRLFYMLPRKMTDDLLPLEIQPQPKESVRVLVGRLEILTPQRELELTQAVKVNAAAVAKRNAEQAKVKKDPKAKVATPPEKIPTAIAQLGRLAEPALDRVSVLSKDPVVQREAKRLIRVIRVRNLAR